MHCTKKEMKIAVQDGFIYVLSLQFPGKKKMQTAELLNGMTFSDDSKCY
jgi:methionyl-tRNA formyltransferase